MAQNVGIKDEMKADAEKIGLIFVIVGVLFFVSGAQLRLDWFVQNNYVLNAPCLILIAFESAAVILLFGSHSIKME